MYDLDEKSDQIIQLLTTPAAKPAETLALAEGVNSLERSFGITTDHSQAFPIRLAGIQGVCDHMQASCPQYVLA